ncbi:putative 26S protease regulatory subunit S10B-like protein B [Iris pallida]|uniref:26S protease regulatory subunit S10B-like protein B n=1 Tax=Iris pallida TaxID=29817 RepID=A0AAX6EM25_IRIPA|nr:putative 26S protease regulatory subunit S10B-like protein B [Iris pallida]KAJ6842012.1 putative 26S protease regulatory subunit S10B-like protein B [Iris pallida]
MVFFFSHFCVSPFISTQGFFNISLVNNFTRALISFPPLPSITKSHPSARLFYGKLAFCALDEAELSNERGGRRRFLH